MSSIDPKKLRSLALCVPELLTNLDESARSFDSHSYGLPLDDPSSFHAMRAVVLDWLILHADGF